MAHKEIVQAKVNIGNDKYDLVECEVSKADAGDSLTLTTTQADRYNVGLTLEAQRKLRDKHLVSKGLKVSTAKGKTLEKGTKVTISLE